MADVALKAEIYSGAAPGATVKVPGLTANNVPFMAFDVTPAALTVLDDATIAAILATLGPVNANDFWEIYEDFHGGNTASPAVGNFGWRFSGTMAGLAGEANHPGLIRWTPTAGASSVEFMALSGVGASLGTFVYDDCDGWTGVCRFNATANGDHRFGIVNGNIAAATATSGIFLEHLAADTNWFACIRKDGSNITRVDTGVAFGTGWIKAKAVRGATSWIFTINNNAPMAELSATNLPTGTLAATLGLQQIKGSAAQPTTDIDMFSAWGAIAR